MIYSTTVSYIPDYCLSKGLDHSGGHDIFIPCFKCECENLTSSHHRAICNGGLTHVWHCVKKSKLEACHVATLGPKQRSCTFFNELALKYIYLLIRQKAYIYIHYI